jgi:hypothetical protein
MVASYNLFSFGAGLYCIPMGEALLQKLLEVSSQQQWSKIVILLLQRGLALYGTVSYEETA